MKKFLIVLMSLILLFLLTYYIKSQLRINVFKSIGISEYFPFNYLQPASPIVANPQVGVLLKDTFKLPFWIERKWGDLWAREEGLVESEHTTDGVDGSSCLLIKSNSAKDWAYRYFELISVEAGDRFGYEGQIRTEGDSKVVLHVVTYNEKMKVINWNYAAKTVSAAKNWVETINEFEIPQNIKYIQFGLSGSGNGKAWIDNITFSKLQ
jgi:hypothetical protein